MARKGNQQKNGLAQNSSNHKKGISDPVPTPSKEGGNANDEKVDLSEKLSNGSPATPLTNGVDHVKDGKKNKRRTKKSQGKEKKAIDETIAEETVLCADNTEIDKGNIPIAEASNIRDGSEGPPNDSENSINMTSFGDLPLDREDGSENVEFPETLVFKYVRTASLSVAKACAEWLERHRPTLVNLKNNALEARDNIRMKIQRAQPIMFRWIKHIAHIALLLLMVWLDCTVRGVDSFLRMGTTSFFAIVWCSVLSVIAMVGISKFLIVLAVAVAVGLFLGFTLAVVLTGITGIIFLWFYGSFWTTGFIILLGGLTFVTSHDRIALFITSVYSIYCACNYVGWLGLLLCLNLSFVSSDALLFLLRNMINEQRMPNSSPEQTAGFQGQPSSFPNESAHASSNETGGPGLRADRSPGMPSTSGSDSEVTSEDEVIRLLNCTDHYAALGLSRLENIDASLIKKEYRKKAMLVHPDKNMGNEKAAEAFKKLQNAYEILLDSVKRKEYDDELRREELLNYFRKFQNASHENRGNGLFKSGFARSEADGEDPLESRRIACKKCGFFHVWVYTKKLKSRARWCQECKDFHQAKDGDGWVEQSSKPFFFGILQQVEAPSAYVCADGKVYNATEWYICQGMRCPANTHKPTFHVNASVVSKNGHPTKGSGQRGGVPNMEETMTEEEFFEFLQNAMQNGTFENFPGTSSESPSSGFNPKAAAAAAAGGGGNNSSSNKRKKKGKKQW